MLNGFAKLVKNCVVMCLLLGAVPVMAIDFWHAGTAWAGQGQCSAQFIFDGSGDWDGVKKLRVTVSVLDKAGKELKSGLLEIDEFATSEADRYASAFLEGEEICDDDLAIVVRKASAVIAGKQRDLVKEKLLSARSFKPFRIKIGK